MSSDWTVDDRRFMRSLRIVADDPAPPLPRFVVEPGMNVGEYILIDRYARGRYAGGATVFTPKSFENPRAAADDVARQMNEKYRTESEQP